METGSPVGRKATEQQGYSKSQGQTLLARAVEAAWSLAPVKQDVSLRPFVEDELGYPWSGLSAEYGRSLGRLDADVLAWTPEPVMLEFHGRQHFEYVSHFHGDKEGWEAAKERDNQKVWLSQRLLIPMVVFRYDEVPTPALVIARTVVARRGMVALPGISPCPECGRLYPKDDLEAGCPGCARDSRQPKGLPAADEATKERMRSAAAEQRALAKERAAARAATPEEIERKEKERERQRQAGRDARERQKESAKAYQETPEGQAAAERRKESDAVRRDEDKQRRKESADRYKNSEAGLAMAERAKAVRKEAYERAKAAKKAYKKGKGL